ncbi:hypothetical protein L2449_15195 [Mesorhizobium muleiense]|jgi:hypothetical protein|uniref:hypothetical protein n=1 Tax=Mesorhizobium muleiense TaxID=1004279 RepID=UPI001F3F87E2|nr:hypothetical protein [Mesorhizobium muleiense]MCF6118222.1 hypothetical protein [Mesorhizobium muleiense]
MQKIDFLVAEAGKRRLRLIIAFLDFWACGRIRNPIRGHMSVRADVLRRAATTAIA